MHYSEMDGTIIYDIMDDRMGRIWLATQNGLVCYNGYEFKRFYPNPNDTNSISNILTFSVYEDRKGRIWIGSMNAINAYDPYTKAFKKYNFSHLTDFPEHSQPIVISIIEDAKGRIYFGVTSALGHVGAHAVVYYDPKDGQIKKVEYPDSMQIRNVSMALGDSLGNIWLVSLDRLIQLDPDQNLEDFPYPDLQEIPGTSFSGISNHDWDNILWLPGYNPMVYSFTPESKEFHSVSLQHLFDNPKAPLSINCIAKDAGKNLWIGSNQGIIFYDRKFDRFETFPDIPDRIFERYQVNCLHFDSFGNLWIGTASNGLLKYNNRTALRSLTSSLSEKSPITPGWAINFLEASDGKIWFTTLGNGANYSGLNELDPFSMRVKKYVYNDILPGLEAIFAFHEVKPGEFLVHSTCGIFRFLPETSEAIPVSNPGWPDSLSISKFFHDSRNRTWILTNNGIYYSGTRRDELIHIDFNRSEGNQIASNQVSDIFEGRDGGFWVLTNDGLFKVYPGEDKVERHGFGKDAKEVFISQDINSFHESPGGIAWVGTWQGGLSRYDIKTGEIRTFTTVDGLPSMCIQAILAEDDENALWLSTFEGICRFSIKEMQFQNFSVEDGIQGPLFADASCLKSSRGTFFFGGSNGITFFNPREMERNSLTPEVFITDFKVAGKSVSPERDDSINGATFNNELIRLKHFQGNISITYVGIQYSNSDRNKFAYMLENYDDNWRDVGTQRTAYYYNVPPGEYIFRIKASNSNGLWNDEGATLRLVIAPPWWRSWPAYIIYAFILICIGILVDRFQRRRVMMKQQALAKEKELAHAREIEKAYKDLQTTQQQLVHAEKMASLGELTAGIAHEIQNPLNFVNNFSEISVEIMDEIEGEIRKGHRQAIRELSLDLRDNLHKINYHGKRASSIVKGMLEHSRTGTGQKELTDINFLAEEFLRLSYYGIKARDKWFKAEYRTDFDPALPKIPVIPQDIGRVLLNLINNAFFEVSSKARNNMNGYVPMVTVSTKKLADKVEIRVMDNGNGIPAEIREKIFQPFFTTKPAGEGTGLGLSLSYDIITKGHQGEMRVETKEGKGTEFIITIPSPKSGMTSFKNELQ